RHTGVPCSALLSFPTRRSTDLVGGQRGHRVGHPGFPCGGGPMEFLWGDRKFGGIAPDLVEGDEAGGAVERGVLGTHGHDHAAGLLDTAGDLSRGVLTYAQ